MSDIIVLRYQEEDDMGGMFIRDIPQDIQRSFKAQCILQGVTIKDAVLELLKKELEANFEKTIEENL